MTAPVSRYLLRVRRWAAAMAQPPGGSMGGEERPGAKDRSSPRPSRATTLLFTDPVLKSWCPPGLEGVYAQTRPVSITPSPQSFGQHKDGAGSVCGSASFQLPKPLAREPDH